MRNPDTISICRWTEKIPEATWLARQRHLFSLSPLVSWIAWLLKITNCNQLPTLECLFEYQKCCHAIVFFVEDLRKVTNYRGFLFMQSMSCSQHVFTKKWRRNFKTRENKDFVIHFTWKNVMNSTQISNLNTYKWILTLN